MLVIRLLCAARLRAAAERDLPGRGQKRPQSRAAAGPRHERRDAKKRDRIQRASEEPWFRHGTRQAYRRPPGRYAVRQSMSTQVPATTIEAGGMILW